MASKDLINQLKGNNNYIERKGIHNIVKNGESEEVIKAYVNSIQWGNDKDIPFSLEISKKTKNLIDNIVAESTGGGHIYDLEIYCGDNNTEITVLNNYYEVLRLESAYLVDSFFYYIEIDEKDPWKRFYFPRKRVLQTVVGAYQEIYDGKLDFLSVSQPKRTGKTTGGLRLAMMMGGRDPDGSIFGVGKGEGLVLRWIVTRI